MSECDWLYLAEHVSPVFEATTTGAHLRALFEDSPVAIVALDARHDFVMCNRAFHTLFQFSIEELHATTLDELITGPDTTGDAQALSMAVLRGEKVHTVAQRRRKDGMMVDVEIYGIPLIVDGALEGVYGLYQDITERNRAENAVRRMANTIDTLQLEERRRIARDLHDSMSQELAVLNWNLTLLKGMTANADPVLRDMIAQTKEIALQCSSRIRTASYLLHPPLLGEEGLYPVIERLSKEFEMRSGIAVDLNLQLDLGRFSDAVEITIFRVVQEALANVLRHSGSPIVHITLARIGESLILTVFDEGKRYHCEVNGTLPAGVGLSSMSERLEQLGGSLRLERSTNGTTLIASLPAEARTNG